MLKAGAGNGWILAPAGAAFGADKTGCYYSVGRD